jgi:hypothetical protein
LLVAFEPFESRDHDFAGRERLPVLAWGSDRRKSRQIAMLRLPPQQHPERRQ